MLDRTILAVQLVQYCRTLLPVPLTTKFDSEMKVGSGFSGRVRVGLGSGLTFQRESGLSRAQSRAL